MSLYETLGLSKTASPDEIRKAYYGLSKTNHPDRGGDPEKFKLINHAHEVLSDPERRKMYDVTGSDQEGSGGGGFAGGGIDISELFGQGGGGFSMGGMPFGMPEGLGAMFGGMFGGGGFGPGGPGGRRRKEARGPDKSHDIPLSLADFYKGREIAITFQQQRACALCSASGALKTESCSGCKGQGMKMMMRQIGPGMIQQSTVRCSDCNGEGKRVLQVCHECSGKKYRVKEKVLKALIKPGFADGQKMRFNGECSDSAEYEKPGDVVLNLIRTGSSDYDWQGHDLHITHSVSVAEALLGFNFVLKEHPSGKDINLSWGGGQLQHDAVIVAKGLGMPRADTSEFGDLFVHIDVMYKPVEWSLEQRAALRIVFPEWSAGPAVPGGIPLKFQ
jgi:DnaJ family protein A protein 2